MATTSCNEYLNYLEAGMDGEHSAGVTAHLRDCADCRGLSEDLGAIQHAVRTWMPAEQEAPARVWTAIRAQLENEGLIRGERSNIWQRWFDGILGAVPRPALAGAYLAALVAVAVALTGTSSRQRNDTAWIDDTRLSTQSLSAQLDTAEQDTMASLAPSNPVVTASLHDNLAIVDNNIAMCEKSLSDERQNEIARDYLYEAYQQKADLLAQLTERGDNGR